MELIASSNGGFCHWIRRCENVKTVEAIIISYCCSCLQITQLKIDHNPFAKGFRDQVGDDNNNHNHNNSNNNSENHDNSYNQNEDSN